MVDNRPELREISLANIGDVRSLHELLKRELSLPSYYGMNWDAFWEVINDCVVLPRRIIFRRWNHLEATLPREAKLLRECLDELAKEQQQLGAEVEYR